MRQKLDGPAGGAGPGIRLRRYGPSGGGGRRKKHRPHLRRRGGSRLPATRNGGTRRHCAGRGHRCRHGRRTPLQRTQPDPHAGAGPHRLPLPFAGTPGADSARLPARSPDWTRRASGSTSPPRSGNVCASTRRPTLRSRATAKATDKSPTGSSVSSAPTTTGRRKKRENDSPPPFAPPFRSQQPRSLRRDRRPEPLRPEKFSPTAAPPTSTLRP
jgi:hypothetical protein